MPMSLLSHDLAHQAASAFHRFRAEHGLPPTDPQLAFLLHCSERTAWRRRKAAERLGLIWRDWPEPETAQ